jgi:hypothetical protein
MEGLLLSKDGIWMRHNNPPRFPSVEVEIDERLILNALEIHVAVLSKA